MTETQAPQEAWDFVTAVRASRLAKESQQAAQTARKGALEALAESERIYRKALAEKILGYHSEGVAWTTCGDLARGDKHVADLRYQRDIDRGVVAVFEGKEWLHTADRKDCLELIEWSRQQEAMLGTRGEGG